jgi:hypothetical protein
MRCVHNREAFAWMRRAAAFLILLLACALAPGAFAPAALAHDIPADVRITAFVKPLDHRLELLIRVPLAAMIEVDFPRRGPGYLDLARAEEALRGATKLYLTDNIAVYENGAPLPREPQAPRGERLGDLVGVKRHGEPPVS